VHVTADNALYTRLLCRCVRSPARAGGPTHAATEGRRGRLTLQYGTDSPRDGIAHRLEDAGGTLRRRAGLATSRERLKKAGPCSERQRAATRQVPWCRALRREARDGLGYVGPYARRSPCGGGGISCGTHFDIELRLNDVLGSHDSCGRGYFPSLYIIQSVQYNQYSV